VLLISQNQIIHCNNLGKTKSILAACNHLNKTFTSTIPILKIQYCAYACIGGLVGFQYILVGGIIQVFLLIHFIMLLIHGIPHIVNGQNDNF
jgi:hypothetical protein